MTMEPMVNMPSEYAERHRSLLEELITKRRPSIRLLDG
jgi:hypothetical protein